MRPASAPAPDTVRRGAVYLVNLDPAAGDSEIKKTRPCIVISPDEMNAYLRNIIVAPLTSQSKTYGTRLKLSFQPDSQPSNAVLDQVRTIDKARLVKHLGQVNQPTLQKLLKILQEMFAE